METAYREMQFTTMANCIRNAKEALQEALKGVDAQDAPYVMLQAERAKKHCQLVSFHSDHYILVAEQEQEILTLEVDRGNPNDSDNSPPRTSETMR